MLKNIALSHEQKQIILGGLLGDAYFNKKRVFIRFSHCKKQEEYLKWKYSFFDKNDVRGFYYRKYKEGYENYSFEFTNKKNKYNSLYSYLHKNLYSNKGRKKISLKYLYNIDAMGLAVWWLDDGHLSIHKGNRYGKLSTHCFNYEEHILLQKYFKEVWGIRADIKVEKGKYYFLRFNVKSMKKLIKIIYKYVCQIPSMIYKIDLSYKNNVKLEEFEDVYLYIKQYLN